MESPDMATLRALHNVFVCTVDLVISHLLLAISASRHMVLVREFLIDLSCERLEQLAMPPCSSAMAKLMDHRVQDSILRRESAESVAKLDDVVIVSTMVFLAISPVASNLLIVKDTNPKAWRNRNSSSYSVCISFIEKLSEWTSHLKISCCWF
jgi:hypothetical protein